MTADTRRTGAATGPVADPVDPATAAPQLDDLEALRAAAHGCTRLRAVGAGHADRVRHRAVDGLADVRGRAARRPGGPRRRAVRRPGRAPAGPRAGAGRDRPRRDLRDQRREALPLRAARHPAHPQDARGRARRAPAARGSTPSCASCGPTVVATLGATAAKALLGSNVPDHREPRDGAGLGGVRAGPDRPPVGDPAAGPGGTRRRVRRTGGRPEGRRRPAFLRGVVRHVDTPGRQHRPALARVHGRGGEVHEHLAVVGAERHHRPVR